MAGGVTAPRGSAGGLSPVDFIRGMRSARARIDAYAHHPYPLDRAATPFSGGCGHCETITMATLERLLREVSRNLGAKRIWLTEYGYQTNPPDRTLGVSFASQARLHAQASRRVYLAPRVDMLIHYLYRDEPDVGRWQSGLTKLTGAAEAGAARVSAPARAGRAERHADDPLGPGAPREGSSALRPPAVPRRRRGTTSAVRVSTTSRRFPLARRSGPARARAGLQLPRRAILVGPTLALS